MEQIRDLGLNGEVLNPLPEIELLIELETELDLGMTITRDDITERQFQALIMIRKFRNERAESQAKAQQAQAFHQAAAARARSVV